MGYPLKHACVYLKKALYTYKICIIDSSQDGTFIWSCLPPVNAPAAVQPLMFNSGLLWLCLRLVSSMGLLDVIQYLADFVCLYAAKTSGFKWSSTALWEKGITWLWGIKKKMDVCFWGQIIKTQGERNGKGRGGASRFLQTTLLSRRVVSFFLLFWLCCNYLCGFVITEPSAAPSAR